MIGDDPHCQERWYGIFPEEYLLPKNVNQEDCMQSAAMLVCGWSFLRPTMHRNIIEVV
jgi:hypothetical protein